MPSRFRIFLQRWIINVLAVLVAASVVPGLEYARPLDVLIAALLLGLLNVFVRPVLLWLSLPLLLVTLGLFTLVINAALLYLVGWLLPGFHVQSFGPAFWGALIISFISLALNAIAGTGNTRVEYRRGPPSNRRRPPPRGGGPVIDV